MPLSGAYFQIDTSKVHQLLKNYLVSKTYERWISSIEKRANGRDNFDDLRRHDRGEVNVSRCVATSDRLRETLHYKSECALSFNTFLDKMQKMFNIFRNEEEPMADRTQVHELFWKVQHPQLQDTVKSLEVRDDLDGITYSEVDNHLTAVVSKMPEYQFPESFLEFSSVEATVGSIKVAAAAFVKVDATAAASTIPRGRSK